MTIDNAQSTINPEPPYVHSAPEFPALVARLQTLKGHLREEIGIQRRLPLDAFGELASLKLSLGDATSAARTALDDLVVALDGEFARLDDLIWQIATAASKGDTAKLDQRARELDGELNNLIALLQNQQSGSLA